MPPVSVDRASMLKVAKNLGQAGKPLPPEMASDPAYLAAHDQGSADGDRGAQFHPPAPTPKRAPAKATAPKPAAPAPAPTSPGGRKFSLSGTAAAVPTLGGDGGGLLLALVLYPLVLATIQHGAAGPGLWFRAKWLNQTVAQPANLPDATHQGNPGGGSTTLPKSFPNGHPIPGTETNGPPTSSTA